MYECLIIVDLTNNISTQSFAQEISRFYANSKGVSPEVSLANESVLKIWPNFKFKIHRNSAPHVLLESEEIAERSGENRPNSPQIARCALRFEILGGEDPYIIVLQRLLVYR